MEYDHELELREEWEKGLPSRANLKIHHQKTPIQNDWVFIDIFSDLSDEDHVQGRKFQLAMTVEETKRLVEILQKELALFGN